MPQKFASDGIEIAFIDEGEGYPALLIHGFGSNHRVNWVSTSWTRDLVAAGRRVIAFDNRGHGESSKPHDPTAYRIPLMAEDGRRLLDHLGVEQADVMGYSMGARIALSLALAYPARVRSVVLGGLGEAMVKRELFSPPSRSLRHSARLHSIRSAIRAAAPTASLPIRPEATVRRWSPASSARVTRSRRPSCSGIAVPVLVAVGSEDADAGSAEGPGGADPRRRRSRFPAAIT